jgi:SAM-dependent methyltransferase
MTALAQRLKDKYFKDEHPYRVFEREVEHYLRPKHVLLDAGCGRAAPILAKFTGRARRLIGVDLVDFAEGLAGMELLNEDLGNISLPAESVDLVMSRAVMEHITEPDRVYREIQRILKPGGHFVFLTANLWDYASILATLIPNRYHASIVSKMEGRAEHDVFPTAYRTNTRSAVTKWARRSGLELASFRYLGQYPSYFMFNGFLFLLATGYQKLISRATWLNFLQGWILVTLRKPEHTNHRGS